LLETFVVTLREGLEAALAIGIVLLYIRRSGRTELNKYAYLGLVLAVFASIAGAVLFNTLNINPENEFVEGSVMLVGAIFVGSMVVWMMKNAKSVSKDIEQKINSIASKRSLRLQGLGLMAFAFILVFREGIETVLFLAALSLRFSETGNPALNLIEGVTGLLLAAAFGVMIMKGMLRINLRLFFTGTGIILLVLVASLLANAIHEFSEIGLLPSSTSEISVIGLLVKPETSNQILIALVALPVILLLLDSWKPSPKDYSAKETPVQRRMRVAQDKRARTWKIGAGLVTFMVVMSLGSVLASSGEQGYDPMPVPVTTEGGKVIQQLIEMKENGEVGMMQKFSYVTEGGHHVRFFTVMTKDGPKAAYDVCYICPAKGYYQTGDEIICKNCGAPTNIATIGLPGGCNPRVLTFTHNSTSIIIDKLELEKAAGYFP